MKDLDTFILAGGKGNRFQSISKLPKIFAKLGKTKLIDIILKNLKKNKINRVNILAGKNHKIIKNYLEANYNKLNINIVSEDTLLGTAGCFSKVKKKYLRENILIIFGDLLFDIDLKKFNHFHLKKNSDITILTHPSDHLFDSDILEVDSKNQVKKIYFKPHKKDILVHNLTMAGIFIIKKKCLNLIPHNKKYDFSKNFLKDALNNKSKIFSYKTREYCKDLGTPTRFKKVNKDFKLNKNKLFRLNKKIRAVFLDRDGVINVDQGPLKYSSPLNFLPNSVNALSKLRKLNYLVILITNQSAVAKGFITINELEKSFKSLETILSKKSIYFDSIYYCPHYPTSGYKKENKNYKINCSCRKPKPGMILRAKRDFNIDLKKSFFVGDSLKDYMAAKASKVKPIILQKLEKKEVDYIYKKDLLAAIKYIERK